MDENQIRYLSKKQFWNDVYTKVDEKTGIDTMYELNKKTNYSREDSYDTKLENKED